MEDLLAVRDYFHSMRFYWRGHSASLSLLQHDRRRRSGIRCGSIDVLDSEHERVQDKASAGWCCARVRRRHRIAGRLDRRWWRYILVALIATGSLGRHKADSCGFRRLYPRK